MHEVSLLFDTLSSLYTISPSVILAPLCAAIALAGAFFNATSIVCDYVYRDEGGNEMCSAHLQGIFFCALLFLLSSLVTLSSARYLMG